MKIKEIEEEIEILSIMLSSGSFIAEIVKGEDRERVTSRYVEIFERIKDAEGQLVAEMNKIKAEVKHRLTAALVRGDLESERDALRDEYGAQISASLSRDYDVEEVQRLLKDAGLLEAAVERGALDVTPTVKASKMTKEMKTLLADAGTPKLSRVTVTRLGDD